MQCDQKRMVTITGDRCMVMSMGGNETSCPSMPNMKDMMRGTGENDAPPRKGGVVNLVCAGETSWHGFASAIVSGLKSRGATLAVETIVPIATADFPTKAKRPANSCLDLSRLKNEFGVTTPNWRDALIPELDDFVALQNVPASR